ncbi:hypothetical protein [Enterobacter phage vB_EcRAM-01]|nr:hypothetical protein [Enterobacter phage vB_EcRAM-01]
MSIGYIVMGAVIVIAGLAVLAYRYYTGDENDY